MAGSRRTLGIDRGRRRPGGGGWRGLRRLVVPDPRRRPPEAANIDDARPRRSTRRRAARPRATAGIEGDWTVDTSVGSFDDFSGTWAGYRFDEELASIGTNTAVGRTPDVTGTMTVAGDEVTARRRRGRPDHAAERQRHPRRRARAPRGLESDQFPTATFSLTEPLALPDGADDGERVSAEATGELTIHGVTQPVTARRSRPSCRAPPPRSWARPRWRWPTSTSRRPPGSRCCRSSDQGDVRVPDLLHQGVRSSGSDGRCGPTVRDLVREHQHRGEASDSTAPQAAGEQGWGEPNPQVRWADPIGVGDRTADDGAMVTPLAPAPAGTGDATPVPADAAPPPDPPLCAPDPPGADQRPHVARVRVPAGRVGDGLARLRHPGDPGLAVDRDGLAARRRPGVRLHPASRSGVGRCAPRPRGRPARRVRARPTPPPGASPASGAGWARRSATSTPGGRSPSSSCRRPVTVAGAYVARPAVGHRPSPGRPTRSGGRCSAPRTSTPPGRSASPACRSASSTSTPGRRRSPCPSPASPLLFAIPWVAHAVATVDRCSSAACSAPTRTADRVDDLEATRAQAVDQSAATLRRIERDLHDGTQARLVALAMHLDVAREQLDGRRRPRTGPAPASCSTGPPRHARRDRRAARGDPVDPPAGARPRPRATPSPRWPPAAACRPTSTVSDRRRRPSPAIETIAYYCAAELLTNVGQARRRHPGRAVGRDRRRRRAAGAACTDDGRGGARPGRRRRPRRAGRAGRHGRRPPGAVEPAPAGRPSPSSSCPFAAG